jgi:hypothetical protein
MPQANAEPPFEAYLGDDPFVFVSYAHKDSAAVFPEIAWLHDRGYKIWYDEGIDPGNEWPDEVAKALEKCAFFVVFVSPTAVSSKNVKNEINFALNEEKPFLAIHLQETTLSAGLKLRMGDIQAIYRYSMTDERYHRQIEKAVPSDLRGQLTSNKVFISYASADRDEVFRRIQVLDLLGIETYLDVGDLRAGEKWEDSIRGAIDQTKFMILFWSKAARESQWVEKEWRYALDRRGINYIRPLPLCLPNEAPPPSELAELHFGSPRLHFIKSSTESTNA